MEGIAGSNRLTSFPSSGTGPLLESGMLYRNDDRRARKAENNRRYRRRFRAGISMLRITARLDHAENYVRRKGYSFGADASVEDIEAALTDLVDRKGECSQRPRQPPSPPSTVPPSCI
jgi:hypothetical protein